MHGGSARPRLPSGRHPTAASPDGRGQARRRGPGGGGLGVGRIGGTLGESPAGERLGAGPTFDGQRFADAVAAIWASTLGLKVEPGPKLPKAKSPPGMVTSCLHIAGGWEGAVTLDCAPTIARDAAAILFGIPPGQVRVDQLRDAVGVLVELVGNAFNAQLGRPCQLSLAAVTQGTDYVFRLLDSQVVAQLCFRSQGAPFQVVLFRRS